MPENSTLTIDNNRKTAAPPKKRNHMLVIGIPIALVALIAAALFYLAERNFESTDDAYIDSHVIPVSAKVAGQVAKVSVRDNQPVGAGDVMVTIDPVPFQAKLDEEQAKLDSAEVEARRALADAARYDSLYKKQEVSQQQFQNAEAAARAAQAAVERERAAVEQSRLNLSYTRIVAPESGTITRKSVEPGMYVQVGQGLLSVVPKDVWVTANFKETQLTDMRPNQPVTVAVDAYPDRKLHGHVESIQVGTGARFSLFPPENATGNFVKVVQRVPVKIVFDEKDANLPLLAAGMSVEAKVKVR